MKEDKTMKKMKQCLKRILVFVVAFGVMISSYSYPISVQASEMTYTLVCENNVWTMNGSPLEYCSDKGGWDNDGWCYENNYGTLVGENESYTKRLGSLSALYYTTNQKTWAQLFECDYCDYRIWLAEKPESLTLKNGNSYECTIEEDGSYSVQHFPVDYAIYCAGDTTYTIEKIQVKPCADCKQQTVVTVEGVAEPDTPIVYNGQPVDNAVFGTPVFYNGTEQITGLEPEYTYYRCLYYQHYEKLDSNPVDAGIYKVNIAVSASDVSYMGNLEIEFNIQRADTIELQEGEGYDINYENRSMTVYEGYEVSEEAVGEYSLCVPVETVSPGAIYYVRSSSRNYKKHPWKNIEIPLQPAAPSGVKGVAPDTATEENGRITGVTEAMEYTADEGESWISIPEGSSEICVVPGNYGVRLKATATSFSGDVAMITVNTYEEEHANQGNGETGNDNGETGNDSGETGNDSGGTGNDSGETGNDNGETGNDSGETGNDNGETGNDSGETGNDNGEAGNDNGQTGNDNGQTGNDNGQTGNDNGQTGNDNGGTGNENGGTGNDNGQTGNGNGQTGNDNGQTGNDNGQTGNDNGQSNQDNGSSNKDGGQSVQESKPTITENPAQNQTNNTSGNSGGNVQSTDDKANVTAKEKQKNSFTLDAKYKVYIKGKNINVSWGKVKDATGYDVYLTYSDEKYSQKATIDVTSEKKTSAVIKKVNGKAINQKKNIKCYVIAYKTVNGTKVTLGSTIEAYATGTNSRETDAKKLSVKKTTIVLKTGKSATIKAKTVKRKKGKKILKQIPEFRYQSSNTSVATVSKKGKITAKKKGVCNIYVYAVNGYARKVKVSVK